ncbi:B-cell receptor CD22-like isoform X1 [Bufo gargarizans]|uniref:B-cell receptor CD22-like isoform X1 n=1 Tax=Bufo gargarizans TaxID=30331 RepID=UPI001CF4B829|nr:B-cell receptor CD22-like isoform X1 [Bufo gargarizans]
MNAVKQMYLLLICEGFYLGFVCQEWTFPSTITALIGSCVEIPCTYHPANTSGTSRTVWYLYKYIQRDPEILNIRDSSSVMAEYRDRTSLVPGENSCTLRIDPVRGEDGGNYYYPGDRNTDAFRTQSVRVQLHVTDKVNVWLYRSNVMTEGEATIIRCAVDHTCRSSPPSLRWNKPGQVKNNSVEVSQGDWREESELTYIPSYVDHGSPVQCIATYPNGEDLDLSGTLNIKYAPKNVTVAVIGIDNVMEGSDMKLQCNSFSNPAVYDHEWYKGKSKLPDTGREITVRNVSRDMEPYSCAVRNSMGRGESAPTEIPVQYAPKNVTVAVIGIDEVMEGSDMKLQCNSFSNPAVYNYEWYKGKSKLPDTGREITVRNVSRDMEPYFCAARNHLGREESAPTEIPVQYAPKNVTVAVIGIDEVMEGSDMKLQCNSFSNPAVYNYEWYKGKSKLPDTGREITVRNASRDMEPYSCAARNHLGRGKSAPTEISLQYAPKNVTVAVIGIDEVMEGSDVKLQCNSFSNPAVYNYEWYKGKSKFPDTGREITVRNVSRDMEPYSCAARNHLGRGESAPTEIPVQYAPKNVTVAVIGIDEVMEGSDVKLQCSSFSNPAVYNYEWYKGKSKLPDTGREITVRNVSRDMEPYSCAARNRMGRGKSSPTEISLQYKVLSSTNIIIPATIGTIFSLLLLGLVALATYFCWRKKKCQKLTSNETEAPPDATYTDLIKQDIESDYEQFKTEAPPDATYTDLIKRDIENDYEQFKTEAPPDATYTDLIKRDIENDYEQFKTETCADGTYTDLMKKDMDNAYEELKDHGHREDVHNL